MSLGIAAATFAGGFLTGVYSKDYREDRDWCRSVEAVLADVQTTVDTMQSTQSHNREALQLHADRLDELIAETPPYRHELRRDLEPLQTDLAHLADTMTFGPPIPDYDHADEPDDYGDLNRIDFIIDRTEEIEAQAAAADRQLAYGIFALIPQFLYYNVVPATLRSS